MVKHLFLISISSLYNILIIIIYEIRIKPTFVALETADRTTFKKKRVRNHLTSNDIGQLAQIYVVLIRLFWIVK